MVNHTAKEAGNLIGQISREGNDIKDTGFGSEQYGFNQITAFDDIKSPTDSLEVYKQLIGNAFILGHPVNGKLGTSPFTLGETAWGARSKVYVNHAEDTYIERFGTTRFLDTGNTSATLSTSTFDCTFSGSVAQELRTSQIFYDNITSTQVNNVIIQLEGANIIEALVAVATNGSTYVTVPQNTSTAVTAGNDLRVKITNGLGALGWPTAFGTWGTASIDSLTITELKVIYTVV